MTLLQLQLALRAHLRVLIATLLIVLTGALIVGFLLPKVYKSSATLVVDVRSADSVLGNTGLPLSSPAYMNTQADIISSVRVVDQTIRQLKLEDDAGLRDLWQRSSKGQVAFRPWLVDYIQSRFVVSPGKESNTLMITVATNDPEFSALLANGLARAYVKTSIELNVQPAREYALFFEQQLKEARDELIEAQTRLSDFQREHGMVVVNDERMDVENNRLNELSSTLTQVQALRAEQSARAGSSGKQGLLQDPTSNVVLNTLRSQLQQKESQLAEASARIGANHPEYARIKAEVEALKSSVQQEIARNNASLSASASASFTREASVRKELDAQRSRILKLKENRDAAMTLQRDVESAQKQFEMVAARTSLSEMSSRQTASNAFLVSEASPPLGPSSPKLPLIVIAALMIGLILGAGLACIRELLDRRVRSRDDFTMLGLPVLAVLSPAQKTEKPRLGKSAAKPQTAQFSLPN